MKKRERIKNTYFVFPVNVCREFVSFIEPQVNCEFVIDATTQFVLLNMNVETIGDIGAFAVRGN